MGKANYYKKIEDWTNLTATLEQLAKLQPNFITFWKFQAWNLTYNVSVEFDDYHDRYYYVRRGIEFLQKGERYNSDNPQLLWDLGWFIGQKIGRADEYVQYRRLFKADDDFHPGRTARPTSATIGSSARNGTRRRSTRSTTKARAWAARARAISIRARRNRQMNYAEAIEEEGFFEKARRAWIKAGEEWRQFGYANDRAFHRRQAATWVQQPRLEKEVAELRAKLEGMLPGVRAKLVEEKRAALTAEDREVLDTPAEKLTPEQAQKRYELEPKIAVTDREVAERIAREQPANAEPGAATGQRDRTTSQTARFHNQLQARRQLRLLADSCRIRANGRCDHCTTSECSRPEQGVPRCRPRRRPRSSIRKASPSGGR